ncbi:hypothetical protein DWB68_06245 [Galactobacter valiniphilus]|uniref:Uncharacterized protein n=1 Tax=Galactobacter valiniphilus TaxID=2676122 RepID=A0A399JDA5_9MICC|nr:hypothetical protein [Galactobacter valiniphilus]RII42547.1 hypothetical protein DWB68_06245 [Galactobacter valiniphilus]
MYKKCADATWDDQWSGEEPLDEELWAIVYSGADSPGEEALMDDDWLATAAAPFEYEDDE